MIVIVPADEVLNLGELDSGPQQDVVESDQRSLHKVHEIVKENI